ncbi:kinase-like domain-containing protein [Globomyces pollinis-pini]|nr:kinase-like domain-containing protein [Globomyces pollinis-pini]
MMNDMIRLPDALIIVSELAPKGTLLSYIQKHGQPGLTEPLAKTFFIQLSQAIHYLHTIVGIIHHDIKLENILLDEELTVKLADFGLSEEMELIEQADVDRGQNVYEPNTMKSTDRHSAKTNDPPGNEHFSKDTKLQTNKDSTSKQVSKDTKLETSKNQKPKEITKKPEPTLKYLNPQFQSDIFSTPYATKSKLETNFININPYHHHRQSGHPPDCPGFCCTIHQPTSEKFQLHIPRVRNRDHNVHAGSLHYLAPEELRAASATYIDPRKDPNSIMNLTKPYCDIWALGCCLYALVVGTLPFSDSFLPRLQMKIINGQFDHGKLVSARISRDCILLLERLLDVSIDTRYTIEQVLESDWVKS